MSDLTSAQKAKITENIQTLDYLQGTGVIATRKRKLADEVFLFISTGGTGYKALTTLRRQMAWKVDPAELKKKVQFLIIDTAHEEVRQLTDKEGLIETEVYRLPFAGAHDSINPATMAPQMKQWVDPELFNKTGGNAETAPAQYGFDSSGAGAWRQPGRIRLCQPNTLDGLRKRLDKLIRMLVTGHNKAMRLNVFFLAGLAGGTGSGTIIDLPFLTRQIIKNLNGTLYHNTKMSAYLLLPSACGTEEKAENRARGNSNAYAALKEIDYHMGLQDRKECFSRVYDTFVVEINENIFDFCTLVEGIADGAFLEEPDKTAQRVTANSILNLITIQETKAGNEPFLVDSFFSNRSQQILEAVSQKSHRIWPRDVNYTYNVIGYAACVVPIDLMTVYVANKVFEHLWERFERFRQVDPEDAYRFLMDCGLAADNVYRLPLNDLCRQIDRIADDAFKEKGPYFMVTLLSMAVDTLYGKEGEFFKYAQRKATSAFGERRRSAWRNAVERYEKIEQKFLEMNNKLYDVYTFVIDEMAKLFRDNAKLLTDTKEYSTLFERTFCWSPVDLSVGTAADNAVLFYLDKLLSPSDIENKANQFVDLLCSQKDVWTQLEKPKGDSRPSFDAARLIRGFIQAEFKDIVDATMESFLVKLYTNDPHAEVPEADKTQDPQGHIPIEKAANELVTELSNRAQALVQTRNGFMLDDCYKNLYITVPDGCKWLDKEIADNVAASGCRVYLSAAQDEIVFYRLYVGVPAWALSWVEEAERVYEQNPSEVGLHIEKGEREHNWLRFPNLFHESKWGAKYRDKLHGREIGLSTEAKTDMETARDLNLVKEIKNSDGTVEYAVYVLDQKFQSFSPEELFQKATIDKNTICTSEQLIQDLKQKNIFIENQLKYVNEVTITTEQPPPDNFGWDLACRALRRMLSLWDQVKDTIHITKELNDVLDKHNMAAIIEERIAKRRQTFLNCLVDGLIQYNPLHMRWEDVSHIDKQILGRPLTRKLERECKEYYAAQAFYALEDDRYQRIVSSLDKMRESATDDKLKARSKRCEELKSAFQKIRRNQDDGGETSYPMASPEFAEEAGADAQTIRSFYDWMIREL